MSRHALARSRERLPTARRVGAVAVTVAFGLFVLAFVVHGAPALVGAEESYVVLSGSMQPSIDPGDVVFVYATDPAAIEPGDVITFTRGSNPVPTTHRVVGVETTDAGELTFRTKGDHNEDPDPGSVPARAVLGTVPAVTLPVVGPVYAAIPRIGYVVEFAKTPAGLLLLVVVPLALLAAVEAWRFLRAGREERTDSADAASDAAARGEDPLDDWDDPAGEATDGDDGDADHPVVERAASEPAGGDSVATSATGGPISVGAVDLRYATLALAAFAAYAIVTAALHPGVWTVVVAVAVSGLAGMAIGVGRGWFAAEPTGASGAAVAEDHQTDGGATASRVDRDGEEGAE
ncbi:MAG: signal peptidase I [Haloarculaceae archaeon]